MGMVVFSIPISCFLIVGNLFLRPFFLGGGGVPRMLVAGYFVVFWIFAGFGGRKL